MSPLLAGYVLTNVAWPLSEVLIFRRDRRPAAGERVDDGSRRLIVGAMIVAVPGAIFLTNWTAADIRGAGLPLLLVGLALMWAGIGLRAWAVRTLGRYFRTHVTVLDEHRLVEHGVYARLRNPSYAGALLTCLGFGLTMGNWASLALVVGLPGIGYIYRIRVEERALAGRFGAAWQAYRARSWALLPPLW